MSKLLAEAIADAKAVREMAVKQAEEALKEVFSPKVNAMISRGIQAEMDGVDGEFEVEDEEEEEVEEATISPGSSVELGTDSDHEEAKENSGLTEEEGIEEVADSSDIGTGDNKEPSKDSSEETTDDPGGEVDLQSGHDDAKENSGLTEAEEGEEEVDFSAEEETDEVELEAIVNELEAEVNEEDEYEEEEEEAEAEPKAEPKGEEEVEVEAEPEAEPEAEVDDEVEAKPEDDEEEELDLEGLVDEAENEIAEESETLRVQNTALKTELAKFKSQYGEAIKVVTYQKKRLNEINILNAKLLFANKVFRNYTLDNKSKLKVVENFDLAKSVREVKLVYATLMESLGRTDSKTPSKVQRLAEGASKQVNATKKINESPKEEIVENDDMKSRVHKLMGFKKK